MLFSSWPFGAKGIKILPMSTQRILSVDIFRGLTIFMMLFVNELAGVCQAEGQARLTSMRRALGKSHHQAFAPTNDDSKTPSE